MSTDPSTVPSTVPAGGDLEPDPPEPRWPALVAALAVGGLYLALPGSLAVGPRWLFPVLVGALLVPLVLSHSRGHRAINMVLGHALAVTMTLFMVYSLALLLAALPAKKEPPVALLRSAAALWATNVLVFALWYWRLDGGGPYQRDRRVGHPTGSFLFPQMTLEAGHPAGTREDDRPWSPTFVDYLFISFNTSTAFSPTDAPVLSRWAKVLVMTQSSIALTVVVMLAARAVNIL